MGLAEASKEAAGMTHDVDPFASSSTSPPRPLADIVFENYGSVCLLRPVNHGAEAWLGQHTAEDALWFGDALVVEPRYVAAIIEGAVEDGLRVCR